MLEPMGTPQAFWNSFYEGEDRLPWDMGRPTPVLAEALDLAAALGGLRPGAEVVVPGCGYGHDAAGLAERGFRATGLDFSPHAIAGARSRYGDSARWTQADWYAPALGPWDAIFDHTCFVAMPVETRGAYVATCAGHLRPGGLWLLVAFHDVEGRPVPPHPIPMVETRALAEAWFEVLHLGVAERSHPRRAGREHLLIARRR